MTTFLFTWNATFETLPPDAESESQGASRIRDLKTAVSERTKVDHSWAGDVNDGKHKKVTLMLQAGDPSLDSGDGCLYTKTVSGNTELFYRDSHATSVQLTRSGLPSSAFAAQTQTVFIQAAAPTGWSFNAGYADRMLRMSGGVGGGVGGGWVISGLQDFGHALTLAELPNFQLVLPGAGVVTNVPGAIGGGNALGTQNFMTFPGGGAAHSHVVQGDGSWRPAYVDAMVCFKQ